MRKKIKFIYWGFFFFLFLVLSACSDNFSTVAEEPKFEKNYVLVIYSVAGIGDMGFLDNIYAEFQKAKEEKGFVLESINPLQMDSAELVAERFFAETETHNFEKRLLVFVGEEYSLLLKNHPEWKQSEKNSILLVDGASKSSDVYSREISLYGVSYLVGATVADMKIKSPFIFAPTPVAKSIVYAIDGFSDGYKAPLDSNIYYFAEDEVDGFDDVSELYYLISLFSLSYTNPELLANLDIDFSSDSSDFLFPLMGGANVGVYRALRETGDEKLITCSVDADQRNLSDRIAFSIVRRMDLLVDVFLQEWIDDKKIERHVEKKLEDEYVEIVVADHFKNWEEKFKKNWSKAIEAEKKYLNK